MAKKKKQELVEDVTAAAHSKFGPSKAHRWLYCHASVAEESQYPSTTSVYAEEGSCAHRLAELCLIDMVKGKKKKPESYIGKTCDETGLVYTQEMVDSVHMYLNVVASHYDPKKDSILVEEKLHCPEVHEQLYGTADCIIVKPRKLVTVDFKFGRGVIVKAEGNEQMLTYSMMAAMTVAKRSKFKQIIVQPRVDDPAARNTDWDYGKNEMQAFRNQVGAALIHVEHCIDLKQKGKQIPDKYYAPNEKRCHFCKHSGNCEAQDRYSLQAMQQDYEVIENNEFDPPKPHEMSAERVAFVLEHRKAITEWLNSVEAHAIAELQRDSRAIPEFKVVHGRSNRSFKSKYKDNPRKALKKLLKALPSLDKDDVVNVQLRTVRQIEQHIKNDEKAMEKLAKFWEKPPGKLTLVNVNDGRKGISSLDDYE